jgi:hypothetical protein
MPINGNSQTGVAGSSTTHEYSKVSAGVILAGVALAGIGTFLPWITLTTQFSFGPTVTNLTGIDGDGKFVLVFGIVAGLLGVIGLNRPLGGKRSIAILLLALPGMAVILNEPA